MPKLHHLIMAAALGISGGCGSADNAAAPLPSGVEELDTKLAAALPDVLQASGAASVSVAHVRDGRIVAAQAIGFSAPEVPATAQTRYNVASLTKPVSAEVVLRLISEGRFSLDDPMAPSWVDPDIAADPRHLKLTPRLALSHRTGFPNWRDQSGLKFETEPGGKPGYSGEGYEYVATYVQHLTGAPIDEHAGRLLFGKAGMEATSYTRADAIPGNIASSRNDGAWTAPTVREKANAADDLITTASDYARFMIALMQEDALTPALVAERSRVQADRLADTCAGVPVEACPSEAGFALGWEIFVIDGQSYFMHTGADADGFSLAYWTPADKSGTVILTNNPDGYRAILPVLDALGANPKFVAFLRAQASK